jgi:2-polyprenyl-3-methyl-5-hydroxy-6-metoxy-1,4-benzoquinol methylase
MSDQVNSSSPNSAADFAVGAPACPVSHSTATQPLCHTDGFEIWRCAETATDFVWPMPSDHALKEMYDREAYFEGGEHGGYANYDLQTEHSLQLVTDVLDRFPDSSRALSVLDIGCSYGSHLRLAADRQWKCFGIELSEHARHIAKERHGDRMTIVERAQDLPPQCFDLVLMLEVIEHLKDPYAPFFALFDSGAIGPETLVVITTPNARSNEAVAAPDAWPYRHPPSHLVYYSAKSLALFLRRLQFKDVRVRGIVDMPPSAAQRFDDEEPSINDELGCSLGICAEGRGSDFARFMRERYVTGAPGKLQEYAHLPRYAFARSFAQDAQVLDFGCGSGYGAALLAQVAASVVGVDSAAEAIDWAKEQHRIPTLRFLHSTDSAQELQAHSFDLVTCLDALDPKTQLATIGVLANLLKPGGKLVVSTPNHEFSAARDAGAQQSRAMTEVEFETLLRSGFEHVAILKQWVRPSIFIGRTTIPTQDPVAFGRLDQGGADDEPLGLIAVCSNRPFEPPPQFCQFDTTSDSNAKALEAEQRSALLRLEIQKLVDSKELPIDCQELLDQQAKVHKIAMHGREALLKECELTIKARTSELAETRAWVDTQNADKEQLNNALRELNHSLKERDNTIAERENELQQTRAWVANLTEGKDWLAGQNQALEKQLAEHKQLLAESENRLDIIQRSKAWRALRKLRLAPKL